MSMTSLQPGAAVITASTGELTAICTVTVKNGDSDYLINDSGEITAYLGTSWSDLTITSHSMRHGRRPHNMRPQMVQ